MAKLITYQYLRNETDISQNIPDDELDNPIKRAQDVLSMIIGNGFYNNLITEYPNSLSEANNSLYNPYVKQFLAWQSYQFWLVKANFKTTRSGIRVHSEDNSEPANDKQMAELVRDAKEAAQTYKERMVSYIVNNSDSFPFWNQGCNVGSNLGNGFHITAIKRHSKHCNCGCNRGTTSL